MERGRGSLLLLIMLMLLGFLLLSMLLRVQRGLLGLILTAILVVLGFYWFKEIRKALEQSGRTREYPLEISEEDDMISLTAQVPGPESEVSFEVKGNKLLLRGGMGFRRVIKLPYRVRVLSSSYINGILHIKLLRADVIEKRS
ncbi:MAG: hypothetical protein J7L17_02370 [Thaumarchaeota archaeon]|nr:hypothetical protein [Nitrososphaerota archaeon]